MYRRRYALQQPDGISRSAFRALAPAVQDLAFEVLCACRSRAQNFHRVARRAGPCRPPPDVDAGRAMPGAGNPRSCDERALEEQCPSSATTYSRPSLFQSAARSLATLSTLADGGLLKRNSATMLHFGATSDTCASRSWQRTAGDQRRHGQWGMPTSSTSRRSAGIRIAIMTEVGDATAVETDLRLPSTERI